MSLHAPDGNSARRWEKERHGETSLSRNWSHSLFSRVCFYTLRCYTKVTWGQQSWLIKIRCFIQMYTKVLGVLHHLLARGPANNLWPCPCDSGQSTRTLISPGVILAPSSGSLQGSLPTEPEIWAVNSSLAWEAGDVNSSWNVQSLVWKQRHDHRGLGSVSKR